MYNFLKKTIFTFQTDEVLRESLDMFDSQNNESMNNEIKYTAQKKIMAHIISLNNRISCLVVIYIFRFKKYWQTVFNLMEINMIPTSKQLFQPKTVSTEKKKHTINYGM